MKQSILSLRGKMDCFASLAMTVCNSLLGCLKLNQERARRQRDYSSNAASTNPAGSAQNSRMTL
jgi:hypothetical protein